MFHPLFAMKPDTTRYEITPNHYGLQYRRIDFYTSDNVRLVGWLIPVQEYKPLIKNEYGQLIPAYFDNPIVNEYDVNKYSAKPTIILSDGDAGNMCYNIWIANEFSKSGFNTFLFDWRGFGESQHWKIDKKALWLSEFRLDLEAAIEIVANLQEVDSTKICAYGTYFGFADIFVTAVKNHKIKCIGGQHLISNLVDFKKCLCSVNKRAKKLKLPPQDKEFLYPIDCADKLECPIYCMVGEYDIRTPVWMEESIFLKIKSTKKLNIVLGAGEHCGLDENDLNVYKEVCNFFKENL